MKLAIKIATGAWSTLIGFLSPWWLLATFVFATDASNETGNNVLQPLGWGMLALLLMVIFGGGFLLFHKNGKRWPALFLLQATPFVVGAGGAVITLCLLFS